MQAVVEKTWIPNQADLSGNRVQGNGTILRGKEDGLRYKSFKFDV
jgi:hypothetical protein